MKIGDKVKLLETSVFFNNLIKDFTNPINVIGEVISIETLEEGEVLPIHVYWDEYSTNYYDVKDLEVVE